MTKTAKVTTKKKKDIVTPALKDKVELQGKVEVLKPQKPMKMTANQIAYEALRSTGLNHYQTTKQLGLSKGYGYDTNGPAKKSYATMVEKLMPASIRAIKKLSEGKPVGDMPDVKGSDVIAANKMIWDRVEPIKTINESNNLHTFIEVKVDMEEYRMSKAIDATPSKASGL